MIYLISLKNKQLIIYDFYLSLLRNYQFIPNYRNLINKFIQVF